MCNYNINTKLFDELVDDMLTLFDIASVDEISPDMFINLLFLQTASIAPKAGSKCNKKVRKKAWKSSPDSRACHTVQKYGISTWTLTSACSCTICWFIHVQISGRAWWGCYDSRQNRNAPISYCRRKRRYHGIQCGLRRAGKNAAAIVRMEVHCRSRIKYAIKNTSPLKKFQEVIDSHIMVYYMLSMSSKNIYMWGNERC